MAGGRPLKFTNVDDLWQSAMEYIKQRQEEKKPITLSGIAYALDVCTQTLINYTEKDEFFAPIKRLRQIVEMSYEDNLHSPGCTGTIFALKNLGWKDTQDINQNNTGAPQVIVTKNYLPKAE